MSLSVTNYSWPDGPADVAGTLDQVVAAADRGGIDTVWVADVEKTINSRFDPAQPVEAFVEHCAELAALGIDHVILITTGPWTGASVERLAQAVPALASH